jgi:hypothetical protein
LCDLDYVPSCHRSRQSVDTVLNVNYGFGGTKQRVGIQENAVMIVQFNDVDLVKWSRFSGDYNPIHFDEIAVSRVGRSEPVAHGMLAMLALKDELEDRGNTGAWRRWSASLKQPIDGRSPHFTSRC